MLVARLGLLNLHLTRRRRDPEIFGCTTGKHKYTTTDAQDFYFILEYCRIYVVDVAPPPQSRMV